MPIWGNSNRESAAEDASAEATPAAAGHENDAPAGAVPETGTPSGTAPEGEPRAGEPAPAFWRAQGRPVVLDAEAVVKDPALTGTAREPAEAVNLAIEEVVSSLRARQRALASSWQGTEADTEQLRTVLRQYRGFGAQVQQMSPAGPAGEGRPPRAG